MLGLENNIGFYDKITTNLSREPSSINSAMETPDIKVEGTQGVFNLEEDQQISELIRLIVAAQPYLFLPAEDGMEALRHFIQFRNQQLLMKNWQFSRPRQYWEIQSHYLNMMGHKADDGQSFVGLSIPHQGVAMEQTISIYVAVDETAQTATLYLPSEQ